MPTILKDASITAISLVDRGANLKKIFLYKRAGDVIDAPAPVGPEELWHSQLIKAGSASDEWSTFYCVVAVPNEVDQQGDVWTADEIRKAAHDFVEGGGLINFMHETMEPVGKLVESSIALSDMRVNGENIPKGSWYIAVKPNEDMKKAIQRGDITGISVQGSARREPVFTPGIDSPGTLLHTVTKAATRTLDGKAIKEGQTLHLVTDPSKAYIVLGEHPESGRLVLGNSQGETVQVDGLDLITTQTAQAKMEQVQAEQAPTPMKLEYAQDGKSPFSHLYEQQEQSQDPEQAAGVGALGKAESVLDGTPGAWRTIRGARAFVATDGEGVGNIIAGPSEIKGINIEGLSKRPEILPAVFEQPVIKDAKGRTLYRGDYVSHVMNPDLRMPVAELTNDSVVVEMQKDGYPFPMQSMVSPRQLVYSSGPIGGRGQLDDLANALIDDFDENSALRDALGRYGVYNKDQIEDAIARGQLKEKDVRELVKLVDGAADSTDDRNVEGSEAVGQAQQQFMYKSGLSVLDSLVHTLNTVGVEDMAGESLEKAVPKHPAAKCAVGGCANCIHDDVEKSSSPFPGAAPPFTSADGGKKKKKSPVGSVDENGEQVLPGGSQVEDADLSGITKDATCECGGKLDADGTCLECGMKHKMAKAAICECGGKLDANGTCLECGMKHKMAKAAGQSLQWAPAGVTEGDLDDGDFAWLSDAYKAGDEPESAGRKLPYKVNGEVNERGWRAAWSMASKTDLSGGPSLDEVRAKLLRDKPDGVEVSDSTELSKGTPVNVGGKKRLYDGGGAVHADFELEGSEKAPDDESKEDAAPGALAVMPKGKVRLNSSGKVEKHFDLGSPHEHPHDDGSKANKPFAQKKPKVMTQPQAPAQPQMMAQPAVKAGGFPPSRTPDQPMGGKMGPASPANPAAAAEDQKPKLSPDQKSAIINDLVRVAQSGDAALLQFLQGMNIDAAQLPMVDIPDDQLLMMQQKFLQNGRKSATPPAPDHGFAPPAAQAQGLIDTMTKMVASQHGVEIAPHTSEHPKKRLGAGGGNLVRGHGVRLVPDGSVQKMSDEIQPGKLFIGPDGKRYIAREVTDSSVVGFAGGREVRMPRGQVKLAHGGLNKRDDKVGDRLPFPEGLLSELEEGKKAHFSTDDVVEIPDGTVARVYDVSDDRQTVVVTYPHNNLPRRREYPYDQVKLLKAAVKIGDIVKLPNDSAAEVESVEGSSATVVTVGKDLREHRKNVPVSDLEVLGGTQHVAKVAPSRGGSMGGHDPRKFGKIRHIVRQFGTWAGGKHSICVARLRSEHPEVAHGHEDALCAWLKDQWAGTTHWRHGRQGVTKDSASEAPPRGHEIEGYDPNFTPSDSDIQDLFEMFCQISGHDPSILEVKFDGLSEQEIEDLLNRLETAEGQKVTDNIDHSGTTSATLSSDGTEPSQSDQSATGLDKAREIIKRALGIQHEEVSPDSEAGVLLLKAMESLADELVSAAGEDDENVRKQRTGGVLNDFGRWFDGYSSSYS